MDGHEIIREAKFTDKQPEEWGRFSMTNIVIKWDVSEKLIRRTIQTCRERESERERSSRCRWSREWWVFNALTDDRFLIVYHILLTLQQQMGGEGG